MTYGRFLIDKIVHRIAIIVKLILKSFIKVVILYLLWVINR